ncbi:Zinc finger putative Transcription Factor family [Ditylenchus destructor]|nr:Zinc finger putative Transcription Factor family [Ditylenchus destructor]
MFFCVECDPNLTNGHTFSDVNDLEVHLINAHFKIRIYQCSECAEARFPTEFSLLQHYTSTHNITENFEIKYNLDYESIAIRQRIQECLHASQCGIGRYNRSISPSIDRSASSSDVANSASLFTDAETTTAKDKQANGFVWLDNKIAEKDVINTSITAPSRTSATYSTSSTVPILSKSPDKGHTIATGFSNTQLSNNGIEITKSFLPGEVTSNEQNGLQLLEQISQSRRLQKKTSTCQSKTNQDGSGWTMNNSGDRDNIHESVPRRSSRRSVPRVLYQEESCTKDKKRKRIRANTPIPTTNRATLMSGDRSECDRKYKTKRLQRDDRRSVSPEIFNSKEKCKDRKSILKKVRPSTPAPARSRSCVSSVAPHNSGSSSSTATDVPDVLKQFWQFIREEKYLNADK